MNILPTSNKIKKITQIIQRKSLVVGNYLIFQLYVQIAEVNLLCKPTSSYRVLYYAKVISPEPIFKTINSSHIDNKIKRITINSPY